MQNDSFDENPDENPMDINNNPKDQEKIFLINSQEELVSHLKNAHDHEGGYVHIEFGIGKYLVCNPNNDGNIIGVKLFDMLCDGVIAPNAITNLDEILQYKDAIFYFDNFLKFLYWFYKRDFSEHDIGENEWVAKGVCSYATRTELESAVGAFGVESLNQNPTKYIINLGKQKDFLKKESYTQEDPLENYLLKESVDDISDLKNLLNEGQKIPWSKLAPAVGFHSITELNTLKEMAVFGKNDKICGIQCFLFADNSVGDWQELFGICDNGAKHNFIFYQHTSFGVFKDGAWRGFDLNDTQTLKEYGLIKQSRFKYLPYVLWDIGRIIVWAISFGKCCKYKYEGDAWFEKTGKLYKKNCDIEEAIQKIKENQEKEPVSEQSKDKEEETEEDKNKNNIEVINGPKPETDDNKHQNDGFKDTEENTDLEMW